MVTGSHTPHPLPSTSSSSGPQVISSYQLSWNTGGHHWSSRNNLNFLCGMSRKWGMQKINADLFYLITQCHCFYSSRATPWGHGAHWVATSSQSSKGETVYKPSLLSYFPCMWFPLSHSATLGKAQVIVMLECHREPGRPLNLVSCH